MRKTLSLVLSIVMVLSLAIVGISAADATEIKTAEEFAAMAADGNYKLGADITIAASYGAGETATAFTGTFDGNGHTVTVSAPMFAVLSGTVKNLVINGALTNTDAAVQVGTIAGLGKDTIVIDKVVNNATIDTVYRAGGLVGQINKGATVTITNCTNNGAITQTGTAATMVGGILGYIQGNTMTIENCINNGVITVETGLAGGIVGRVGGDYAKAKEFMMTIKNCLNTAAINGDSNVGGIAGFARGVTVTIEGCTNKANVTAKTNDAAGILSAGNVTKVEGVSNVGNAIVIIKNCLNEGNVESLKTRGAGIIAYNWAGTGAESVTSTTTVVGCINKGTIKGLTHVSQICAYTNKKENVIEDNVGLGKVEKGVDSAILVFYAFSSADIPAMKGNVLVEGDGTEYFTYTATKDKTANIIKIADMAADCGLTVKKAADAQTAAAALGTVGYVEPKTPTPDTGDSMIWVAVIALVSIMGMGIAVKARNN